ncbi:MAG: electron transport complex subunit RsxC [Nitrospirota bacterium]
MIGLDKEDKKVTDFRGGVHPHYEKSSTEGLRIEKAPIPERVIIPLSQHIGSPCSPVVKVGDHVRKGDKIGETSGVISSPVHASISGRVTAIAPFPHPNGRDVLSIVIESDGKDEWREGLIERKDYLRLDPELLKEIILEAGIVGLGGAAFPTYVKLNPPKGKKIDTIVLNGAECEPYLTADHRIMAERPDEVVEGLRILMRILGVDKGYIGIEENKPDAISILKKSVSNGSAKGIQITELEAKYPQGGEKQLIKAILNREVPSGGLPMDLGILVQNVGTAMMVYRAVRFGWPLIERVVTITGKGIKRPRNLEVRIGTRISEVIKACGGFSAEPGKVVIGGPMMGMAQYTLEVPVVKGTTGIIVLPKETIVFQEERTCIKCGMCVKVCPMGLIPNMISIYSETKQFDEAMQYHPFDCIECGCCAYVCPSKIPIVQLIRHVKSELSIKRSKAG